MALSAARNTKKQVGDPIPARVGRGAAVDILYKGGMAAINAAGYLAPAGLAVTDTICGRFVDTYDNSGGSAGDITAEVEQGVFRWTNGDSIVATDIGAPCYASDDQTITKADGNGTRPFAGVIVDVDSVGVWVIQGLFLAASAAGAQAQSASVPRLYAARGASTANVANLAAFTVANDGITLAAGEIVLLKDQSAPAENGLYVVGTVGAGTAPLTRATFFDDGTEVAPGAVVHVSEGTANADRFYFLATNVAITVGTTSLTFTRQPDLAQLASTSATEGAALIGYDGGTTVKAALDTILSTGIAVASKTVGFAVLTDADQQQDVAFDAALPAGACIIGWGANVTAVFDNAGDTADLTFDLGTTTGSANLVDGGSLDAVAKVSTPAPAAGHPSLVGAVTPSIRFDSSVNLNTLTKGSATFYVLYSEPF